MLDKILGILYFSGCVFCLIKLVLIKYQQAKTGRPWEQLSSYNFYAHLSWGIGFLLCGVGHLYTHNFSPLLIWLGIAFITIPMFLKSLEAKRIRKVSKVNTKPFTHLIALAIALFIIANIIFNLCFVATPYEYLLGSIIPIATVLFVILGMVIISSKNDG